MAGSTVAANKAAVKAEVQQYRRKGSYHDNETYDKSNSERLPVNI